MAEQVNLYLTPLAVLEAPPSLDSLGIRPEAATNAVRCATGNSQFGSDGFSIVIASQTEIPPFNVRGTEKQFVAAAELHTSPRPVTAKEVIADTDVVDMCVSAWTADTLAAELLHGAQAKARRELRERAANALTLGYIGIVGAASSLTIEQWPVAIGLAATGLGLLGWAAQLVRQNRRTKRNLDARYREARKLENPFTVVLTSSEK